jgi:hypothetical protein
MSLRGQRIDRRRIAGDADSFDEAISSVEPEIASSELLRSASQFLLAMTC